MSFIRSLDVTYNHQWCIDLCSVLDSRRHSLFALRTAFHPDGFFPLRIFDKLYAAPNVQKKKIHILIYVLFDNNYLTNVGAT